MLSRQRVLRSGCTDGTQADFKEQVAPVWILDVADSLRGFRATGGEGWPTHTANRHVQEPDDRCRLRSRGVALVRVFRQRPAFRLQGWSSASSGLAQRCPRLTDPGANDEHGSRGLCRRDRASVPRDSHHGCRYRCSGLPFR